MALEQFAFCQSDLAIHVDIYEQRKIQIFATQSTQCAYSWRAGAEEGHQDILDYRELSWTAHLIDVVPRTAKWPSVVSMPQGLVQCISHGGSKAQQEEIQQHKELQVVPCILHHASYELHVPECHSRRAMVAGAEESQ